MPKWDTLDNNGLLKDLSASPWDGNINLWDVNTYTSYVANYANGGTWTVDDYTTLKGGLNGFTNNVCDISYKNYLHAKELNDTNNPWLYDSGNMGTSTDKKHYSKDNRFRYVSSERFNRIVTLSQASKSNTGIADAKITIWDIVTGIIAAVTGVISIVCLIISASADGAITFGSGLAAALAVPTLGISLAVGSCVLGAAITAKSFSIGLGVFSGVAALAATTCRISLAVFEVRLDAGEAGLNYVDKSSGGETAWRSTHNKKTENTKNLKKTNKNKSKITEVNNTVNVTKSNITNNSTNITILNTTNETIDTDINLDDEELNDISYNNYRLNFIV
jgi:hypothetical protein